MDDIEVHSIDATRAQPDEGTGKHVQVEETQDSPYQAPSCQDEPALSETAAQLDSLGGAGAVVNLKSSTNSPTAVTAFSHGRVFLPAHPSLDPEAMAKLYPTFKVLSYNILAQCNVAKALSYCIPAAAVWERRCSAILREVAMCSAHIVCLQDVDHFDYWQAELSDLGYDSVFKRRTCVLRTNTEGLVVAWKRSDLQTCRLEHVDLNHANKEEPEVKLLKAIADDVAILVMLQPKAGLLPTALCVVNTQLHTGDSAPSLHLAQARYLAKRIQRFNATSQVPLVLCGSFNAPAGGFLHQALSLGRRVLIGGVPRAPDKPVLHPMSRSSFMVQWSAVPAATDSAGNEYPIKGYHVAYRPGGNTNVGFAYSKFLPEKKCLPSYYKRYKPPPGCIGRYVRFCPITELSSNVAYEVKICAENACGRGPWSPLSDARETMSVYYGVKTTEVPSCGDLMRRRVEEEQLTLERKLAQHGGAKDMIDETQPPPGPHTYATPSGAQAQYVGGMPNVLTSPVRMHMLQYFPSCGNGGTSDDNDDHSHTHELHAISTRDGDDEYAGERDPAYENALRVCSAYATYSPAGEAPYTQLNDQGIAAVDYIFHSAEILVPLRLLSIPALQDLEGWGPGQSVLAPDYALPIPRLCVRESSGVSGGAAISPQRPVDRAASGGLDQQQRSAGAIVATGMAGAESSQSSRHMPCSRVDPGGSMYLIPNLDYPSDHLAVMAELAIVPSYTSAQWRSFKDTGWSTRTEGNHTPSAENRLLASEMTESFF